MVGMKNILLKKVELILIQLLIEGVIVDYEITSVSNISPSPPTVKGGVISKPHNIKVIPGVRGIGA